MHQDWRTGKDTGRKDGSLFIHDDGRPCVITETGIRMRISEEVANSGKLKGYHGPLNAFFCQNKVPPFYPLKQRFIQKKCAAPHYPTGNYRQQAKTQGRGKAGSGYYFKYG